jgi:hypothetical protein
MKRRLTVLFTLAFFLGYPGCECYDFSLITGADRLWFTADPNKDPLVEGGEFTSDSLHLIFQLKVQYYAESGFSEGTMSSADAFSFDCDIPMANEVVSIIFMSNNDFNDIPAGEPLNTKIISTDFALPVEEFIPMIDPFMLYYDFLRFTIIEKPIQHEHTFSIKITDNAQNVFVTEAKPVLWH